MNSLFADGTSGVRTLGIGGNGFLGTSSSTLVAEAINQLSWFSRNNKHRLKLSSELRRESYDQDQTSNAIRHASRYLSLDDFAANRPASYSRALQPRIQSASQVTGALSLGDSYRRTSDLQIQYGVRLDANRFSTAPTFNPELERLFGERNDRAPNHLYASPRIGFSWSYGTAPTIAGFEGAVRGPRAVVRGGIGVFQGLPVRDLHRFGDRQHRARRRAAAAHLRRRRGADARLGRVRGRSIHDPVALRRRQHGQRVRQRRAQRHALRARLRRAAQRAIESQLERSDPRQPLQRDRRRHLVAQPESGQHARPQLQADRALHARRREVGAPCTCSRRSIVPATGAIASRDARVSQQFNRVSELRSDLRSETKQLRVGIFPASFNQQLTWSLNYTLADVREQYRGFQSTAGNPLAVDWSRSGGESRHQISYTLGYNFFDAVRVNWFGQFRSGTPFTPTISADVNGDGYANDRAFVFDPARASDPAVASAMRSLLESGSGPAKDCLARQLGALASRNSCRGPWTSNANLSISLNPMKVRLPQRATLSFSVSNPLGAADLLLHGAEQPARLGTVHLRRSDAALCARLRLHGEALQVRGEPALRQHQPAVQFVPRAGDAHHAASRRRRAHARAPAAHAAARSRPDETGPADARVPAQGHVRHGRHHQPDRADPAAERHPRSHRTAGGQPRDDEPRVHGEPRQHLDARREVPRQPSRTVRPGRGVRTLHRGAKGVGRPARQARSRRSLAPHRRAAPQAPRARRQLSRHALSRRHPQRHRRQRRRRRLRRRIHRRRSARSSSAAAAVEAAATSSSSATDDSTQFRIPASPASPHRRTHNAHPHLRPFSSPRCSRPPRMRSSRDPRSADSAPRSPPPTRSAPSRPFRPSRAASCSSTIRRADSSCCSIRT